MSKRSNSDDLEIICAFIRDNRVALLTTVDRDGQFHTRPLQTLQVEPRGTLWFFTDWYSPKVGELERDVRLSLGYANAATRTYIAISGAGRLYRDPVKARQLWTVAQRAYYPKGPEDLRLAILSVRIVRAEYWIAPGRLAHLAAAARAMITGKPVEVVGENHKIEVNAAVRGRV